ncbi:hypothetical protein G7054_g5178 [Neopestalotiopsis clavispora]|nr:hypothetical protein G7054_g5178 [Neopestalotiopsis clavispora]
MAAARTATPAIVPPTIAPVRSKDDEVVAGASVGADVPELVADRVVDVAADVDEEEEELEDDEELVELEELEEELLLDEDEKLLVPVLGLIVVGSESVVGVAVKATALVIIITSVPLNIDWTVVARLEDVPQPN